MDESAPFKSIDGIPIKWIPAGIHGREFLRRRAARQRRADAQSKARKGLPERTGNLNHDIANYRAWQSKQARKALARINQQSALGVKPAKTRAG